MSNTKTICDKENIMLTRDKYSKLFKISFDIKNNRINLPDICTFSLWDLIYKLNENIIDGKPDVNITDNEMDILLVYKNIANDYIKFSRYSYATITRTETEKQIVFSSTPCNKIDLISEIMKDDKYKRVDYDDDEFIINIIDNHHINIEKTFKIDLEQENLPIFVETFLAKQIKKILSNLKMFIENVDMNKLNDS